MGKQFPIMMLNFNLKVAKKVNSLKRILSIITVFCIVCMTMVNGYSVYAEQNNKSSFYDCYISENAIWVTTENYISDNNLNTVSDENKEGIVSLLAKGDTATFAFVVNQSGSYNIAVEFGNINELADGYEIQMEIDGKSPFKGSNQFIFNPLWINEGGVRTLSNGDQVNSKQKHLDGFAVQILADKTSIDYEPAVCELEAGVHTISVTSNGAPFSLKSIIFDNNIEVESYSDVKEEYVNYSSYSGKQIVIEAEDSYYRTSYSLTAKSDNSSADISPSSPNTSFLNYIGGNTWNEPGQRIAWKFTAPEDGLYKIGFLFKQNAINDGNVYRSLKIDGKTPFAEANEIGFSYSSKWQFDSFADESENDYLIYLEKGDHILSLEATLSEVADAFNSLKNILEPLGNLYLDMVMITGETPDQNRDYELHKQIPEFVSTLETVSKNISSLEEKIGTEYNINKELKGTLKNMNRIITNMRSSLYTAHLQIPTYYTEYQTLSAWLYDITNMSLSLDKIIIASPNEDFDDTKANAFEKFVFWLKRYVASYTNKYNAISSGDEGSQPTIKIWVNWGRDQVKVLNTLIQDSFTAENNINVRVEQVNATLVQGVISGNSPDLYLHLARTEPVNLAMRGVLYNLKNFDDYEEVLETFQKDAQIPYEYKGGCYALPDTQSFYVMFCRTDILAKMGIEIPKTWDEFLTATGILQRNNMNTYLPYVKITGAATVNIGAGGMSIFPTMLSQNGGEIYNEEKNSTVLNSKKSVDAFSFWTDFYTKYSLNPDENFYQRFRIGTSPLGIAAYTQYLTFKVSAPEIDGKWVISEIPGIVDENGNINNSCTGAGTGCAIMKSSKEKKAAWEFIKWWVSDEIQSRYSSEVEAIIGESGRTATASKGALSHLSWDSNSLEVITNQWSKVSEIPEVPGSYFVSRSIDQAFWETKQKKSSAKEAITEWNEICDQEVKRKIAEYAYKDLED